MLSFVDVVLCFFFKKVTVVYEQSFDNKKTQTPPEIQVSPSLLPVRTWHKHCFYV